VPLDVRGTRFQKQVWEALLSISFGETRTYGQIAAQLGRPTASRALGAANGRNPISIVMPFHRVIGSSGKRSRPASLRKTLLFFARPDAARLRPAIWPETMRCNTGTDFENAPIATASSASASERVKGAARWQPRNCGRHRASAA
jgi:O-6-methylguanine DNA methyltransferase